jgi:hypothetical protein
VLNCIFIDRHALLAPVVFEPAQPVAAASEVVEVTDLQDPPELFVPWKPAISMQGEEMCLNTFEVAAFFKGLTKSSKGLV